MQHLNLEELARCVDEEPTSHEAAHLEICDLCRSELEEMRETTQELSRLPYTAPPAAQWHGIRARLIAEGLLVPPRATAAAWQSRLVRIAAGLALFVAGGTTGALLQDRNAQEMAFLPQSAAPAGPLVADPTQQLRDAESIYLAALTRYAEITQGGEMVDPVARLAALEGIVLTARAALREAPADPVINGYLLTAMGQREAMLRQISRSDEFWF